MTAQELAQQILAIAHKALEKEQHAAVYIGDVSGEGEARLGLEAIITLCKEVPKDQDGFREYQKKKVSRVETS